MLNFDKLSTFAQSLNNYIIIYQIYYKTYLKKGRGKVAIYQHL